MKNSVFSLKKDAYMFLTEGCMIKEQQFKEIVKPKRAKTQNSRKISTKFHLYL